MKLLLDTHAALWWYSDDERLGDEAGARLAHDDNEVLLSSAVVWEVSIKRSIGKLTVSDEWADALLEGGARALHVTIEHAAAVAHLRPEHGDPFDRMLVAQAKLESAVLVSRDERLSAYGVPMLW